MAWYRVGTVNVTNNSNTVIGVGTAWVQAAAIGETFLGPDGGLYEITAINSNTSLSISPAYKGPTSTAQNYALMPTQGYLRDLAAQAAALVNAYASVKDNAGQGKFAAGTSASPSLRNAADENSGLNFKGNDQIALVTAGVERLAISADGTPSGTAVEKMPVSTAQQAALDAKETPAGALAQIKSFGLGQERFGDVAYGAPKFFPIQIGNSSPTRFIASESGDPQVDSHAPESGQSFSGISISRALRPVQIGVSGSGAGAKLWFRGYSGPASVLADWKQAPSINYNATTASAANVFMLATGELQRSTSSAKYKTQVEPADAVLMQRIIDDAEPIWYRSLCEADPAGHSYWGLIAEDLGEIDPRFVHWARPLKTVERQEQIEEQVDTGEVDEQGQPIYRTETRTETITEQVPDLDAPLQAEGVMYERLVVPLLWHAKQMQTRLADVEQRLAVLEGAA